MAWFTEEQLPTAALVTETTHTRVVRPELRIDFRALSEQKIALIQIMNGPCVDDAQESAIEGLLNLVEAIQDQAIEDGVDETEVFPYLEPV